MLDLMYVFVFRLVFFPFTWLWEYLFRIPLEEIHDKILIVGVVGSCTTLAKEIAIRYGHYYISLDKCRALRRQSDNYFEENVRDRLNLAQGQYVMEGIYSDSALVRLGNALINSCGLIIWNDVPRIVVVWRMLLCALKRRLNLEAKNSSRKSLSNTIPNNLNAFDSKYAILNRMWRDTDNPRKFKKANWPYYYTII